MPNDKTSRVSIRNILPWQKKTLPYIYIKTPLHHPRSEIRLLEILPAKKRPHVIQCRLRSVPLADPVMYEALSYHWSGDVVYERVYVNGVEVPVHSNLWGALLALRLEARSRMLWVDAICIDQAQDQKGAEKRYQLPLMCQIYEQAHRVIVWLGPGPQGLANFPDFLRQVLDSIAQIKLHEDWGQSLGTAAHYSTPQERRKYNIPADDHAVWTIVAKLCKTSWVSRLWCVQEVAVAREVRIQWGEYQFNFDDLAAVYGLMWTLSIPAVATLSSHFKAIVAERVRRKNKSPQNLLQLVIRHWLSDCKFKQDKIYALRGLACDVRPGMHTNDFNYDKSTEAVFIVFARDAIRLSGNLDILSALSAFHKNRSNLLPSWVPDWRVFASATFIYRRPESGPDPGPCTILFTASKGTRGEPKFSADSHRIQLQGHILDTIVAVGHLRPATRTAGTAVEHFVTWRNNIARCDTQERYVHTDERMLHVFYHTLTWSNLSKFFDHELAQYESFDIDLLALNDRLVNRANSTTPQSLSWLATEKHVVTSASRPCVNRRMIRTKDGYIGVVHGLSKVGDKIALFQGGAVPFVIREHERVRNLWRVVGDGYVHGVMNGEAWDEANLEEFWIG